MVSFDNVQHYLLLEKVARRVQDAMVLHLLKLILKATGEKGVPQGGVITPLTQKVIWGAWLYWRWATAWRETLRNWNAVANRDGVFSYQYLFHH
ncbi:MAG TPA: hypothetical protein VK638_17460, partial [Edaphobacter sp.]|nr:hypothetical protein [Edaphobacter sp.]